jgi:hypothetical protein
MANKDLNDLQAKQGHDPVHRPSHYTSGAVECIDAIEAALGPEGFIAFLRGQVIKYNWRLGRKDAPPQDAGKAKWYMDKLAERCGSSILKSHSEWGEEKARAKRVAEQNLAATSQSIQGAALTDKKEISNGRTQLYYRLYGTASDLQRDYGGLCVRSDGVGLYVYAPIPSS